jgi:hypothetical protein
VDPNTRHYLVTKFFSRNCPIPEGGPLARTEISAGTRCCRFCLYPHPNRLANTIIHKVIVLFRKMYFAVAYIVSPTIKRYVYRANDSFNDTVF